MSLTRRQREILEFLRKFLRERGYAPSMLEIGKAFSLSSSATIHKHLCALEARGAIRRSRGRRRYVELVDSPSSPALVELPLLGAVPAGKPLEALEVEETIAVPEYLVSGARAYVLRVRGDSMREEQIRDGDYVVVEDRPVPENGETVVALLHGEEVTLKKFHRERGKVRLSPANPAFKPMLLPAKDVRIQGVVRGLFRRY
jgi:repressor LexA